MARRDADDLGPREWSPRKIHPPIGKRIRLVEDVERYPDFIAPAGMTGVIVQVKPYVAVKMDKELKGAEQWDNEVHWYPQEHPGQFDRQVEFLGERR